MIKNIAIFISGTGSNMQAIVRCIQKEQWNVRVAFVLSDNENAKGLEFAKAMNIPILLVRREKGESRQYYGEKLLASIQKETQTHQISLDYIVLAGFMQILDHCFIDAFAQKIINIHPSLLPKFPGLNTAQRAIEAGEIEHGATIHYVDGGVDTGPIIAQKSVLITNDDTSETLTEKVRLIEHELYCGVLRQLLN
jgi:phosphoribosylglycinamide formyltransferase-1